jgi:hypothetical protein
MGHEILTTGRVNVWRGDIDRDELLAIRAGAWSYDALIEWADRVEAELEASYASSPLPREPDRRAIDRLCVELVEDALAGG